MAEIGARTLQFVIRAVAARVHLLEAQYAEEEGVDDEAAADTYQELVDYQEVAGELEQAYDAELRGGALNMIPYDELTAPPRAPE